MHYIRGLGAAEISIHVLREESDGTTRHAHRLTRNFNPRSP